MALALVAGVVSFASPCCLPLMPGYVSYVSGVAFQDDHARARAVGAAALFILGFAVVFTALGASASVIGRGLLVHREGLMRVAGIGVIFLGLSSAGIIRMRVLNREARVNLSRVKRGPGGAFPLGMAFAVGWTPCIGPVLASILTAAASTMDARSGAVLLFFYSLGLGLPFLLLASALGREGRATSWLRAHGRRIEQLGAAMLVGIGALMAAGVWFRLMTPLVRAFSGLGWPPI